MYYMHVDIWKRSGDVPAPLLGLVKFEFSPVQLSTFVYYFPYSTVSTLVYNIRSNTFNAKEISIVIKSI